MRTNVTYVPMGDTHVPIVDQEQTDDELDFESLEESYPDIPLKVRTDWFDLAREICYSEAL